MRASVLGENHPGKNLATNSTNKPYRERDADTWYLFDRPLLADCSLHEESELDLHYNNLWLQLQRWLSFCIVFCILIFIFPLGHTGRKEPLQNLTGLKMGGGVEKNHITNPDWLDFHVANYRQHWIVKAEPHPEDSP